MLVTRRGFIKASLCSASVAALAPATSAHAAASHAQGDRVLVVVQLSGGNDGLNTVVPYADDVYARSRPTLRLPANEVHKIDGQLGFHPRMAAFSRLYQEGLLSVVQGVGCPNISGDHDAAMRTWHTAAPEDAHYPTGWLGRAADSVWERHEGQAKIAFVGAIGQPFAMNAARVTTPAIRSPKDLTLRALPGQSTGVPGQTPTPADNPLLAFVRDTATRSYSNSRKIQAVLDSDAASENYPASGLAGDLRSVAQLIRADTGIQVFVIELGGGGIGGFDNHANQLGNHCALLHQLSESIAAFVDDLKRDGLLDKVLLMTFSEFGRTLQENGRRGTGHGNGAPVFMAGGGLKGGFVGAHPDLTGLDGGSLPFHTDFRRVYATVLERWLGFDSAKILGARFDAVDVLNT